MTVRVDLPTPARVLAVGAHPDDIEFGCAATLAKWADAGAEVHLCICTDGSKGTWDPGADLAGLVAARQDEQRDAAKILGAVDVGFLGRVDGELDNDGMTRAELCAVLRVVRPDVVLGHDPWLPYRLHPDHRAAGLLTIGSIVAARDPHFFPEQRLAPHRPGTLLSVRARPHRPPRAGRPAPRSQGRRPARAPEPVALDDGHRRADPGQRDAQRARFVAGLHDEARTHGLRAGLRAAEVFARIDEL